MENAFEGRPDARQQTSTVGLVTRFRPRYRALTAPEMSLHDAIKDQADRLCSLFEEVKDGKPGRYKSLAITSLEQAVMWAVKELTGPIENDMAPHRGDPGPPRAGAQPGDQGTA